MAFRECFGLGFFAWGIIFIWIQIISDYFSSRDKDINKKEEKE